MYRYIPDSQLQELCASIRPVDPARAEAAGRRLDSLAKPPGSLGRLEDALRRLCAVLEDAPLSLRPARMFTVAADHGVVEEGVASSPQEVTALMVRNFLRGGAAINSLCAAAGVELFIVDAGVLGPDFPPDAKLVSAKIAQGTANLSKGPAMSAAQCVSALRLGTELAEKAGKDGIRALGTGEMGIGNTTASSALFCAYLGFSAGDMTGMGAGVPRKGLEHKTRVIEEALKVNGGAVRSADPFAVLAALGGLEIAVMTGIILGGAARRLPVAIDGFISTAAFVAAWKLVPAVRDYCFFSHGSAEAGHGHVLRHLGEQPLLDLGMRLGEGTGAALGLFLLEAAMRTYAGMATLEELSISLS